MFNLKFMEYIEALFEKKEALLKATKNFYLLAIKAGHKIEDLIKYDYETQEKNSLELIEKFHPYIPLKIDTDTIEKSKNGNNDEFKNLITEKINEEFSYGKYDEFKIVIHNKSGYVNGSHLLKQALVFENFIRLKSNKKLLESVKFIEWFKLNETKDLFNMFSEEEKIKIEDLKFVIMGKQKTGEEMLQGYYIHPALVNSLAIWMSPCYAIKVNKIINEINITSQKKIISSLNGKVKELEARNASLDERIELQFKAIEQMRDEYNKISTERKIIIEKNEIIIQKHDTAIDNLNNVTGKLCKVLGFVEDSKYDMFYIYKIQITANDPVFYTCYRILKENEFKIKAKHKDYYFEKKIFDRRSVNSVKAWIKFKKNNNNIYIKTNGNYYNDFMFLNSYTEIKLIEDLNNLFLEFDNARI